LSPDGYLGGHLKRVKPCELVATRYDTPLSLTTGALLCIDLAMARAADPADALPAAGGAAPKPKPVPLEYYDLRRRFENMPSNEPESAAPAGSPSPAP
jgi:hypothetical protein